MEVEGQRPLGPSDVGRRVRERREELGLPIEAAAARALMDPGYLEYLETAPDPAPSRATILRLAVALESSVEAIVGGDQGRPPGRGRRTPPAELVTLDPATCMELIASGGIGRCVLLEEGRGPVAIPVNFAVLDHQVVFRTAEAAILATAADQPRLAFEVDKIDDALAEGWSVLISGCAHLVENDEELAAVRGLGIRPWAEGVRDCYFRLRPEKVTGRRVRRRR